MRGEVKLFFAVVSHYSDGKLLTESNILTSSFTPYSSLFLLFTFFYPSPLTPHLLGGFLQQLIMRRFTEPGNQSQALLVAFRGAGMVALPLQQGGQFLIGFRSGL